jgi:hypothetical protein
LNIFESIWLLWLYRLSEIKRGFREIVTVDLGDFSVTDIHVAISGQATISVGALHQLHIQCLKLCFASDSNIRASDSNIGVSDSNIGASHSNIGASDLNIGASDSNVGAI